MGWNTKTLDAPFSASWKDSFDEEDLDEFVVRLRQKIANLVKQDVEYYFADEIEAGEVQFYFHD